MTKELSNEICKICGLQLPGKLVFHKRNWNGKHYIISGRRYKEFDFDSCPDVTVNILPDNQWSEDMGWQYPYKQIEEIKKLYDEHDYDFVELKTESIDFGQTENFVKLLELQKDKYSDGLFWDLPPIPIHYKGFRVAFLYTLLSSLNDMNVRNKNKIIKAIKETHWKI